MPTLNEALELRNKVYTLTHYVDATHPYGPPDDFNDPDAMLERAYNTDEGHACGGRVLLFLRECQKARIPARYVGIFEHAVDNILYRDADGNVSRTHASTDVFVDGRWVACDPHYNACFENNNGVLLSWTEIWEHIQNGLNITPVTNGYEQAGLLTNEHMTTYYSADEIVNFIVLGNSELSNASFFPASWDGILTYKDNEYPPLSVLNMVGASAYTILINTMKNTTGKITSILQNANSNSVNSFVVNGKTMWSESGYAPEQGARLFADMLHMAFAQDLTVKAYYLADPSGTNWYRMIQLKK